MLDAFNDGPDPDAGNHYGPMSLYTAAGFTVFRPSEHGSVLVRRRLVEPA